MHLFIQTESGSKTCDPSPTVPITSNFESESGQPNFESESETYLRVQPEPPAVSPRRDVDEDEGIAEGEVDEPDGEEEVVRDGEDAQEEGGEGRRRVPGEHGEREAVADEAEHAEEAGEDRVDDEVRDDGAPLVAAVVIVYDGGDDGAVVHVLSSRHRDACMYVCVPSTAVRPSTHNAIR